MRKKIPQTTELKNKAILKKIDGLIEELTPELALRYKKFRNSVIDGILSRANVPEIKRK